MKHEHPDIFNILDGVFTPSVEGERVRRARKVGRVREHLLQSGTIDALEVVEQGIFADATDDAFSASARLTMPYISRASRMFVLRYEDFAGKKRVLLFHPTDEERALHVPATGLRERLLHSKVGRVLRKDNTDLKSQLQALNIDLGEVDFVAYPHLMRQDIRGLLGSHDEVALLPNAKLLVPKSEWDRAHDPHPVQRSWYARGGVDGVSDDRVKFVEASLALGKGLMLMALGPDGTLSLALTKEIAARAQVFVVSDLAVATDCYSPLASSIKGLHESATTFGLEAIPRRSVRETLADAYTAMIVEKTLAGPASDPVFSNVVPVAELTKRGVIPGPLPRYVHQF